MAETPIPHLHNDLGVDTVRIGVREIKCMGALPPNDHPHVYLDMGEESEMVCPYCSTRFAFDPALPPDKSDPEGCVAAFKDVAPSGRAAGHVRHDIA